MRDNNLVDAIRYYITGYLVLSRTIDQRYYDIEIIYTLTCDWYHLTPKIMKLENVITKFIIQYF